MRLGLDVAVLRAMVVVCLLWHWYLTAAALLCGFYGLLRPGELAALRRAHVRVPSDHIGFGGRPRAIVCVVRAKTRHRAARTQSVIIHNEVAVKLLDVLVRGLHLNELLAPGGTAGLRERFSAVTAALRIGHLS